MTKARRTTRCYWKAGTGALACRGGGMSGGAPCPGCGRQWRPAPAPAAAPGRRIREYPVGRLGVVWYGEGRVWWGAVRDVDGNQRGDAVTAPDRETCEGLVREREADLEARAHLETLTAWMRLRQFHALAPAVMDAVRDALVASYRAGDEAAHFEVARRRPINEEVSHG